MRRVLKETSVEASSGASTTEVEAPSVCECGKPALRSGRCRSCAARLANQTRALEQVRQAKSDLDEVRHLVDEAQREVGFRTLDLLRSKLRLRVLQGRVERSIQNLGEALQRV